MSVYQNAWMDSCWVSISRENGTETAYCSKTRDITIGGGEQGIDVLNVNCGNITKLNRPEPFEITFDNVIPLTAADWRQMKEGGTNSGNMIQVTSGQNRYKFRIAILWANTTGVQATSSIANLAAFRIIIKDCYFTGHEENWTDQLLEGNATFKVGATDATGGGNLVWESITGSGATLSALGAYVGGNFR